MEPAVLTGATEKPDVSAAHKDRRLRAVYRRELQDSVLFSALAVTAGIAVTTVVACLVAPNAALAEILVATPLVLTVLASRAQCPAGPGASSFNSACWWACCRSSRPPRPRPSFMDPSRSPGGAGGDAPRLRGLRRARAQAAPDLADPGRRDLLRVIVACSSAAVWSGEMLALTFTAALAFGLSLGATRSSFGGASR